MKFWSRNTDKTPQEPTPEQDTSPLATELSPQLDDFIGGSPIAVACISADGDIIDKNNSFSELTTSGGEAIEGGEATLTDNFTKLIVGDEDIAKFEECLSDAIAGRATRKQHALELNFGNRTVNISLFFNKVILQREGKQTAVVHIIDTTEQKNLEMRFTHSQKMQAVGQLAGGIAHDFNNLLTAMIGFCDLLLMRHPAGDPSFADIMQVKQNANRAANLVRQLLAFSRRQTLQPKTIDLTEVLAELSNLIRRLIGENIELDMVYGRDLGMVKADQGQIEQVIINLAVNARDAMKDGGQLKIRSENVSIANKNKVPAGFLSPTDDEGIAKGDYVLVTIADSGTGIPKSLIEKVFEPFFSTKEIGHGTGLGLATVYGIIKQTGGHIYINSEENVGTTFALYFPSHQREEEVEEVPDEATVVQPAGGDLTGASTILLVEDETPVRIFAARALRNKGYEVLEADCGENALEVFEAHTGHIDVIISDVMMPGMNGPTMIDSLEKSHPDLMSNMQIIFISGYAEDAFIDSYGTEREFNFLPKPFTLKQLASKIKEVVRASKSAG